MANPLYGQNKADSILAGSSRLVKVPISIVGVTHAAGDHGFQWENPEGEDIIVETVLLDCTTEATGSATIDIGVAANATTSSDTLIDGANVGAAAIMVTSGKNPGTNGVQDQTMTSSQWITGDFSASAAGFVGTFYVKYYIPSKAM